MNAWRMALRSGYKGKDLWPMCEEEKVAVLTYKGIYDIDLSRYSPGKRPKGWKLKGSAPSSMISFAWRIRSGDLIFVRDSMTDNEMIAFGTVKGPYRFDRRSKIRDDHGIVWHHKIDVDWKKNFKRFKYHDRAPNKSVLQLNEEEIESFCSGNALAMAGDGSVNSLSNDEQAKQLEQAYPRSSPALLKLIKPRHRALANAFVDWLKDIHSIKAQWERKGIDVRFLFGGAEMIGELKICIRW